MPLGICRALQARSAHAKLAEMLRRLLARAGVNGIANRHDHARDDALFAEPLDVACKSAEDGAEVLDRLQRAILPRCQIHADGLILEATAGDFLGGGARLDLHERLQVAIAIERKAD